MTSDDRCIATRQQLLTAISDLKADLTWRLIVIMGAQTAICPAIVAALKFVK